MINHKSYDTKRPKEKEMIFGIRAVVEAVDAGKVLDKVLIRRDMSSSIGRELLQKLEGTNTRTAGTDTKPTAPGTHREENGNSKRT